MKARKQLLGTLEQIITGQHDDSKSSLDALTILREQLEQGHLTIEELKDTIIEMLFSAYHGKRGSTCNRSNTARLVMAGLTSGCFACLVTIVNHFSRKRLNVRCTPCL